MSKLLLLTKASLRNQAGLNRFFGGRKPPWLKLCLAVLVVGSGTAGAFGLLFTFSLAQGAVLEKYGLLHLLLMQAILLSSLACFFLAVISAPGQLFFCKDYDLLMSLPVRTSTVLMSKMAGLLLSNFLIAALLASPALIVYGSKSHAGPLYYLFAAASMPFIPLAPVTLAAFLAFISSGMAARFKRNSRVYVAHFTLILLIVLTTAFQELTTSNRAAAVAVNKVLGAIGTWYPPARLFFDALKGPSLVSLALFMALSLGVFALFCAFFARSFKAILSRLTATSARANYKLRELAASSVMRALYLKEFRGYLSCPIYLMNTFFGMVMLTLFSVSTLCFGNAAVAKLLHQQPGLAAVVPLSALLVAVFCTVISCTTMATISLEGRSLWVLKSAPVDTLTIFKAKLLLNLSTTWPLLAANSALLALGLRLGVRHWLLVWGVSSVYALFVAVAGLLINLQFPKLEFKNPVAAVKQSASAFIAFSVEFASVALPVAFYVWSRPARVSYEVYALAVAAVMLVLTAILWQFVRIRGVAWFDQLH